MHINGIVIYEPRYRNSGAKKNELSHNFICKYMELLLCGCLACTYHARQVVESSWGATSEAWVTERIECGPLVNKILSLLDKKNAPMRVTHSTTRVSPLTYCPKSLTVLKGFFFSFLDFNLNPTQIGAKKQGWGM